MNAAKALANLEVFKVDEKLQEAAIDFMVKNLASDTEIAELQKAFELIDLDGDRSLTRAELIVGFK